MATPVGGTWRSTVTGGEWGHIIRRVTVLLAGIESHESSYEPTKFTALTGHLADAIQSLNDAATAEQAGENSGYPA
jgi:hypothetical protein